MTFMMNRQTNSPSPASCMPFNTPLPLFLVDCAHTPKSTGRTSLEGVTRAEQRLGMCLHQPRFIRCDDAGDHRSFFLTSSLSFHQHSLTASHAYTPHHPNQTTDRDLRPLRKPLLTKRSRRCLRDVAAGRPGILLKPKLNPLEGDSSLRAHVGKWWQKDASAVHFLPQAVVLAHSYQPHTGGRFLLRLTNPLPAPVRVAVVPEPPPDVGEPPSSSPYYLRRLAGALGADALVLRAGVAAGEKEEKEQVEVVLEGREDEYLEEDEDGGGGPEAAEASARALFDDGSEEGEVNDATPAVLAQSRHQAWLRVAVSAPGNDADEESRDGAVVGVLLFLRLEGRRGEFAALPSTSTFCAAASSAATVARDADSSSIVVPLCLAFRPSHGGRSEEAATEQEEEEPSTSKRAAAPSRARRQRQRKQQQQHDSAAASAAAAATDIRSFFKGLLGAPAGAAEAKAPPVAPAPAPASATAASAFFEGLLASSGAPAPAPPRRTTRARAKQAQAAQAAAKLSEDDGAGGSGLESALQGLGLGEGSEGSGLR